MTAGFPRLFLTIFVVFVGLSLSSLTAQAQNRVALVIGQSAYQKVVQLPNTANDAKQMTALLSQAGFNVTTASDLSQTAMRQAIGEFAAKVAQSGPQTIAAVFYAGHGLQIDGENFLVPVDVDPQRESDIPLEAVRLNDLMNTLGALPTTMRIYMLDACRNNPFPSIAGTAGKGLAMVDTRAGAQGSFISFSTSPGAEAEDGTGADSPYTTALLQVARDAVPIEEAFKRVRVAVARDTDGRQIPWESSSLTADFRFFGDSGQSTPVGGATTPSANPSTPRAAAPTRSIDDWKKELTGKDIKTAYELVIADDTVPAYEAFVQLFDAPPYGPRVKVFVERRKEMMAWNNAVLVNTAASFQDFLIAYPKSDLAPTAFKLLDRVRNRSLQANAALPTGANVAALAPSGGGGGGNNAPSPANTPQPANASTAPTCTCTPATVPVNIPVIKKNRDDDTPKKKRADTPRGPKPPTDSDIAQSGRPVGPQGPPPGAIMEGVGIGVGIGMGMGGGMRGGGMREPGPMGGTGYHPQPGIYGR
jgi:caspase domain-containing protein